jgi:WD40 repeat protein
MKKILLICFILFCAIKIFGQSLRVYDIDDSDYPIMRAKFYVTDENGKYLSNCSLNDIKIIENKIECDVLNISSFQNKTSEPVSLMVSLDLSNSMSKRTEKKVVAIEMGKLLVRTIVNTIAIPPSEIAIQTSNDENTILQDFTSEKEEIIKTLEPIYAAGYVDIKKQLAGEFTGLFTCAKNGKNKKIALLFTDAMWQKIPDEDIKYCIDLCNENNISFYAAICRPTGDSLPGISESYREIAEATGGALIENAIGNQEVKEIVPEFINKIQNSKYYNISWKAKASNNGEIDLQLNHKPLNISKNIKYYLDYSNVAQLEINPKSLSFGVVEPGVTKDTTIIITAKNTMFKCNNIISSNPNFTVQENKFTLQKNQKKEIKISFTPKNKGYEFSTFNIESEPIPFSFYAIGGKKNNYHKNSKLELIRPNGGEVLCLGADTTINWEGISSKNNVELSISKDNGKNWENISEISSGLKYNWNIKSTPGNNYLLKVKENIKSPIKLNWKTFYLEINCFAVSPDDNMFAFYISDNEFIVMDTKYHRMIANFKLKRYGGDVLIFSPDNTKIAAINRNGRIYIWDINTKESKEIEIYNKNYTHDMLFHPDGNKIFSTYDNDIRVWDLNTGQEIQTLSGHTDIVSSLSISADGEKLVSSSYDKTIKVWDLNIGQEIKSLSGHQRGITCVSISKDGTKAVSGSVDEILRIWDLNTGQEIQTLSGHKIGIVDVDFSPNGEMVVSAGDDKKVKLWDIKSGKEIRSIDAFYFSIIQLEFNKDGSKLFVFGNDTNTVIKTFDVHIGKNLSTIGKHNDYIKSLYFCGNEEKIVALSGYKIKLWDIKTGLLESSISDIQNLAISPNDNFIAYISFNENKKINIWDIKNKKTIKTIESPFGEIFAIAYSPNENKIALTDKNHNIAILDIPSNKIDKILQGSPKKINLLKFHPDGNYILSKGLDNMVRFWDIKSGTEIWSIHHKILTSAIFTKDGSKCALAGNKKYINILDAKTGKEINKIYTKLENIRYIDYHPDGIHIVSSEYFSGIHLWNTVTTKPIENNIFYYPKVDKVKFSNDGKKLLTSHSDGKINLWDVSGIEYQADISNSTFSIVMPKIIANNIDMQKCLVRRSKDSVVNEFVINVGSYKCRIDSIWFEGTDKTAFKIIGGLPKYFVKKGERHFAKLNFQPLHTGKHTAKVYIKTQAEIISTEIFGEGVENNITVINDFIDFGKVKVGTEKDTLVALIKNKGSQTISINSVDNIGPAKAQFSILDGGGDFSLKSGESREFRLLFAPTERGKSNTVLAFNHSEFGSPAYLELLGEGIGPAINVVPQIEVADLFCINSLDTTLTIYSTGSIPLEIENIELISNDNSFTISDVDEKYTLNAGDSLKIDIHFQSNIAGEYNAELTFLTNAANASKGQMSIPIKIRNEIVDIELSQNEVYFRDLKINETANSSVTISNNGSIPITWESPQQIGRFTVDISPKITPPDGSSKVNIQFAGSSEKDTEFIQICKFPDQCRTSELLLKAFVEPNAFTCLTIPFVRAETGDDIDIPIYLKDSKNISQIGLQKVKCEISYNSSMLYSNDSTNIKTIGNTSFLKLVLPYTSKTDTLANLSFFVGFGNVKDSDIKIENYEFIGASIATSKQDGKLTVTNIDKDGGSNLLNPNQKVNLKLNKPMQNKLDINFILSEKGNTYIKIYNSAGMEVKEVFNKNISKLGKYNIQIDMSNFSTGVYFIILQTPTISITKKFIK